MRTELRPGRGRTGAIIVRMQRSLRVLVLTVATAFALGFGATPAWAHGVTGVQPTNYRTTVHGLSPRIPGVQVRAIDLGAKLQLTNTSSTDVVVVGYSQEPYLRIGPRGVFENEWSPAVVLNRLSIPTGPAPAQPRPGLAPLWRQIGSGHTATWHDHRAHWMGASAPPQVRSDPSHRHVVIPNWTVPLDAGGRAVNVTGDVLWIPGPSPWPWAGGALAIAAVVLAGARTRRWPVVLALALALLVGGEALHVAGLWGASSASTLSKTGASLYSLGGCLIGLGALAVLFRREGYDATPVVLIAAVFLLVAGGFADVTSLTRSQLPTTLPPAVARGVVMAALGLGAGLVAGAASRLRRPQPVPAGQPALRTRDGSSAPEPGGVSSTRRS